jgi:iron complex outermembrane receptor protein
MAARARSKDARMSSTIAAAALGALTIGTGHPAPAQAAIPPETPLAMSRVYAIPESSLGAALNTFADKSGLHILYDARVTRSMRSAGLRGAFSIKDGLDRLLGGTGLSYRFSDDGESVSILLAQNDTGARNDESGAAEQLPPIDVGAAAERARAGRGGAPQGPGDRHTGYNAVSAPTTLKTDTPLLKTPISVQVVTRQTMDDQQAISVKDAILTNVSGVTLTPNFFDVFKVRGFGTFGSIYKNGLQEYRYRYLDTTNLQSVEVLKGPAAMLFGRMEPGGIINLAVKRPLETPYYSLQEQVGSFGLTRTTVDMTGPVTSDKSVLYRFNGEFFRTDSYRDFVTDRNLLIAPTISFHPIESFRMNIDFEYQNRTWVDDFPILPAVGSGPAPIPMSRYLSPASITTAIPNHFDKKRIAYDWTYDFAPGWSLTNRLSYSSVAYRTLNGYPSGFDEITGVLNRWMTVNPGFTDRLFATNIDLKGKFSTGPIDHSVLVGFDYFNYYTPVYVTYFNFFPPISSMNIYAPSYGPESIYNNGFYIHNGQKWSGVYGQDMISFLDDTAHVLLGGRYDWAEYGINKDFSSASAALNSYSDQYDKAFSPRVGVLYQPLPWMSLYGNFTRSFGANNTNAMGAPLPPQKGEQFEGGVKAEFFDKRLTLTMAYFDITKTNIPVADPRSSLNTLLIGKARSQGFEFDLSGRIDDNWSVIANYTHDDVRTIEGSPLDPATEIVTQLPVAGFKLGGSPRNYGNLWVKYDADRALRGLSLGAGVTVSESSFVDNANSAVLPGYTLVNAMIAYTTKIEGFNVTAQLNVKNLGDAVYYPSSGSNRFNIITGNPRSFLGSLRVEF